MTTVLVTGNPGSGKSSLVRELRRRDVAAVDADDLAGWEAVDGGPVVVPAQPDDGWLRRHRWVWSRARLERAVAEQDSPLVVVCGIGRNQREMLDLFDLVVLLVIDERTQVARLDAAGDRNPDERAEVLAGRPFFDAEMRAVGAVVVDGSRPTAWVAEEVLRLTTAQPAPGGSCH